MKKISLFLLVAVLLSTYTVFAQGNPNAQMKPVKFQKVSAEQRAKNATDTLQKVVGLSDVQYQKVYDINLNFFSQKKEIRSQMRMDTVTANVDQYKEKEKEAAKYRRAEIEKILMPEQKTKWQEYKKIKAQQLKSNTTKLKSLKDDEDDAIFDGM